MRSPVYNVDAPLSDAALLGWPDVLVLTGLTTAIDRMRQVTAYARTRNPLVVVVGGGHVARAFPAFCATFMDVVCQGDADAWMTRESVRHPGRMLQMLAPARWS